MFYPTKAIANYFLQKAFDEGTELDQMKLQKLVYYAHGWHLGIYGKPLINEPVECWKYGPVIKSLYKEFAEFGNRPIIRLAREFNSTTNDVMEDEDFPQFLDISFSTPTIDLISKSEKQSNPEIMDLLEEIWKAYGRYSAVKLSNMTHAEGSPWDKVFKQWDGKPPKGADVPLDTIREYFEELLKGVEA